MPKRFAKIENNTITNVVVCESVQWLEQTLGGTWVETQKGDAVESYAGIGKYFYQDSQVKFASAWVQPSGSEGAYPAGAFVWHVDRIWQSRVDSNVWEPGVFGWNDPISEVPIWVQPLGAGSEYAINDEVMHNGRHWQSTLDANVWEPGVTGWTDITESGPQEWVQPTGAQDAYALGAVVTHNGQLWSSLYAANVWEPGVFGWETV